MKEIPFAKVLKSMISNPTQSNMSDLIQLAKKGSMNIDNIANLAIKLADSGNKLRFNTKSPISDIPSTGGPSSLSTILCPLFLKSFGCIIPKLGVPGRPAGAIDVLAQIKGYNIDPDPKLVKKWLSESGYAHFLAGNRYAPLDAKFFSYRKKNGAVGIDSLVIASILSKKIALNLTNTGLDIRVSRFGNFGMNWHDAKNNAKRFIEVSSLVDIEAKCFLTNGNIPFQPYIGRGESLLALKKIFEGKTIPSLENHLEECYAMSSSVANDSISSTIDYQELFQNFRENVEVQGGSFDSFIRITKNVEDAHNCEIIADRYGYLSVDLETIRQIIVDCQNRIFSKNIPFPDPCGIIIKKQAGEFVDKNEVICTYRCKNSLHDFVTKNLDNAFIISSRKEIPYKFQEIS